LIEHKETIVACEESGHVSLSYNVLLTKLEANIIVKDVVLIVIAKSSLTYTNCGKTCHTLKTCNNKKIEVLVVPTATVKSIKSIAKTKTQPAKRVRIHVQYPFIICYYVEHRFGKCPTKIEYKTCSKLKLNLLVPMLQQHLNRLNLTMCQSMW